MTIDKDALFQSAKALWLETIRVAGSPSKTFEIYRRNEGMFAPEDDWQQLAIWSFHQALSTLEKSALAKGLGIIHPREITFSQFNAWMRSNLSGDDCWLEERAEFEASSH